MGKSQYKAKLQQDQRMAAFQLQQAVELANAELQHGDPLVATGLYKNLLNHFPPHLPGYAFVIHNLVVAYKRSIENLLEKEDFATVNRLAHEALALELRGKFIDDPVVRRDFADAFLHLGNVFFEHYQFSAALHCFRRAQAIEYCPTYYINLSNTLSVLKLPAKLSDFSPTLKENQLGRHIFITCMPKSGSSFLKNTLTQLTGYRDVYMFYAAGQNEHDLFLPTMLKYATWNTVTQQHNRASEANIQMMQGFGVRPVVLVRNVFDIVISLLDFYRQGAVTNSYFGKDFYELDEPTQIDLIVENVIPWYFQFFASWFRVEQDQRLPLTWVSYEEMVADKPGTLRRILNFYGLDTQPEIIHTVLAGAEKQTKKNRFNQGVVGRGHSRLTDAHKERIHALKRFYPTIDFSRIGL